MPYINTVSTKEINKEKKNALTRAYGEAIELLPGKSEKWLMLKFEGNADMAFAGDTEGDFAMVEVELLGNSSAEAMGKLTGRISEILDEVLGIPSDKVYVKYFSTPTWGWSGENL